MRKLSAIGLLASATAVASIASAQQPQPTSTSTGGVQPLPPPQTTATASQTVLPLPTIAPTTSASAPATVTATATVPPPPPPPPPPPTATVTPPATSTALPPLPPATATVAPTTTEPGPPSPPPATPATATATTPAPPPPPPKAKPADRRADGELAYLYATSAGFGITMGAWIDTLGPCSPNNKDLAGNNVCDPGVALVGPLLLGAVLPLGFFLWDNFYPGGMHRGVPSSIGTGLVIGALEGIGVAGANYAIAGDATGKRWGSDGIMSSVFVGSALGGIGGYAFGEAVRPNPRKIALVASGAGWGAMMGAFFGGGAADSDSASIGQGALVGNLVGINVGLATTGVLAAVGYNPSWKALQYMWMGAGIGIVATSPIYLIYVATQSKDPNGNSLANHGMVANGFGMLAGIIIAGILTRDLKDAESTAPDTTNTTTSTTGPTARRPKSWTPPFTVSFAPLPNGGGMFGVMGLW